MAVSDPGQQFLDILREIRQEDKEASMPKQDQKPVVLRERDGVQEKYCSACKDYHPATDEYFYKDDRSKTGFSSWCKKKTLERQKTYKKRGGSKAKGPTSESSLILDFSEDIELLDSLLAAAKKNRRNPDQEVLWQLEQQFTEHVI